MNAKINKYIPKKYADRVRLTESESGPEGHWLYLTKGWYSPLMGCHTIHEYSVAETLAVLRGTEPCTCSACVE